MGIKRETTKLQEASPLVSHRDWFPIDAIFENNRNTHFTFRLFSLEGNYTRKNYLLKREHEQKWMKVALDSLHLIKFRNLRAERIKLCQRQG